MRVANRLLQKTVKIVLLELRIAGCSLSEAERRCFFAQCRHYYAHSSLHLFMSSNGRAWTEDTRPLNVVATAHISVME